MREKLRGLRLVDEHAPRNEYPCDLSHSGISPSDVIDRAEVDNYVESLVGERQLSDVTTVQLRSGPLFPERASSFRQQLLIDVNTYQALGATQPVQYGQGDPAPTSDLENSCPSRQS